MSEPRRFWTYSRHNWDGWLPIIGHDGFGYRVLLLTAPGLGAVCFRAWKCRDPQCIIDTAEYARFSAELDAEESRGGDE